MIDRQQIIDTLSRATADKPYIYAMWVEGSNPQGFGDEFSDIDLWFSVDDEKVFTIYEEFEEVLGTINPIDFKFIVKHDGQLGHTVYHLAGSNQFLTIDINTQARSRDIYLTEGIDDAMTIFDKEDIVHFKKRDPQTTDIEAKRLKLRGFYEQMLPSVLKNIHRGRSLEALYYYHLILKYATKFLWLKYGIPEKKDFDLKHIYRSAPNQDTSSLECFYDVRVADIESVLPRLRDWIHSL